MTLVRATDIAGTLPARLSGLLPHATAHLVQQGRQRAAVVADHRAEFGSLRLSHAHPFDIDVDDLERGCVLAHAPAHLDRLSGGTAYFRVDDRIPAVIVGYGARHLQTLAGVPAETINVCDDDQLLE